MQYNIKVDVLRIIRASDGIGGWSEGETVLHSNLPCRIVWRRGSEKIFFDKTTHFLDARLYCKVIDITTKDRIKYNNDVFEIVDVSNPDNLNRFLSIDIKRIE